MTGFDLGDELERALEESRRDAESRMDDTCTIRHRTGLDVDEETGVATPAYAEVYAGPCRVKDVEAVVSNPEVGGATVTVRRVRVDIPARSPRPSPGDIVEITAAPFTPSVVGMSAQVVSVPAGTQATAMRLTLEEVS